MIQETLTKMQNNSNKEQKMFEHKPKPDNTKGFHVSTQMSVKVLESFLNALTPTAQIISIAHCGSAGQQVYVVYKI